MIISGSSKGTHTAHNDLFHVNLYPVYVPCCVCFRLFNHHIYFYVFVYINCFNSPELKAHNKDRI